MPVLRFAIWMCAPLAFCSCGGVGADILQNPAENDAGSDARDGSDGEGAPAHYFPQGSWFLEDVSTRPAAPDSATAIAALRAAGGFGNGDFFQIDFGIDVLTVPADEPGVAFTPKPGEFYEPDCDLIPVPLPERGNVEGNPGYRCENDGDCHLIVHVPERDALYEAWRFDVQGERITSGCLVKWDTSRALGPEGRGLQCTSADAAGFPIAPLLFNADEVAAGEIAHAIRFVLPNDRPRVGFVPPATHGTNTTGPEGAPHYGVHLRLRADYPLESLPSDGARVVARALQRYGMYHADGGNIALTAQSDRHTAAKWDGLLSPHDLGALTVEDFEVIDHGEPFELTYECVR